MNRKAPYVLIAIVALVIGGSFMVASHRPICPDDFATAEDQTAAMVAWENNFFDQHPDGSLSDMAEARHQFYIDNHCVAALQRYEDAKTGKADPKTMEMVNSVIRETMQPQSEQAGGNTPVPPPPSSNQ